MDGSIEDCASGFIIDQGNLIITNRHVIEGESNINIVFSDGLSLAATVVGTAALTDIALLHISRSNPSIPILLLGDGDALRIGETVLAIGSPSGLNVMVTAGIASGLNRNIIESPFDDYIQTDAAINHGNSGGPLVKAEVRLLA